MTGLKAYGLNADFEREAASYSGLSIARITEQHRGLYKAVNEHGEISAVASGKLSYEAGGADGLPAVGDWVMLGMAGEAPGGAVIRHILRRKSVLARQAAGKTSGGQVIAANIDTIFICMSLNADFNLRRAERYLTIAWESMAAPVIVLTKSDLCGDLSLKLAEISAVSAGAEVIACSSENGYGWGDISAYTSYGRTVAFVGSSGVGKSTLINRLLGRDALATGGIREDDGRGRHTTTSRQLLLLPGGGVVIDTPGMRELQIYAGDLSRTFEDIEELAARCKYGDCTHISEPGCAVRAAINGGELSEKRLESYRKLQREMSYGGLNSRRLENEKINRMFGGKAEMKQMIRHVKRKNR